MRIYTKTGDKGETSLATGERVRKDHIRLEAYGMVDELSSSIGLLIAKICNDESAKDEGVVTLMRVQNTLFDIGSLLAGCKGGSFCQEIEILEKKTDDIQTTLGPLHAFILPRGTEAACMAHVCRTICRRAERRIVSLAREENVNAEILIYINRLSDYFFCLARKLNFLAGRDEITWQKTCI